MYDVVLMTYITHVSQTPYYNTQTGWYNGWFRDVCHAIGNLGEYMYYRDMESNASFAKSLCGAIPLVGGAIGDFFVSLLRGVYNNQNRSVYLDWASSACKVFEQFQGKIQQTYTDMTNAINDAKAYVQNNLITPINNYINNTVKPSLADAQSKISSITSQLSGFNTKITGLSNSLDSMKTSISNFQSKLDGFNTSLNDLTSRANTFDTKLQDLNTTLNSLTSKASDLDATLKDAQNKLAQYKALIDDLTKRVSALEGKQPTPTEETKPLFPSLPDIFKL